jgi:phage gpG-like protein
MFKFEVNKNQMTKLFRKLDRTAREEVIVDTLTDGGLLLARWSKVNRLSGPRPSVLGVVSGRLRSSIAAGKVEKSGSKYRISVGTNVEYAAKHEFGIGIRPRPFLQPAIDESDNQRKIVNILLRRIHEALKA